MATLPGSGLLSKCCFVQEIKNYIKKKKFSERSLGGERECRVAWEFKQLPPREMPGAFVSKMALIIVITVCVCLRAQSIYR